MQPETDVETSQLREEIIRLGPWHLDVPVTPTISTRVFLEAPEGRYPTTGPYKRRVSFLNPRESFARLMKRIYPERLQGRRFLDCACNCGAYSFLAKEFGAEECLGFDVREHWIAQARFLAEHRVWPSDGIRFEVLDLYDLPKLDLEPFDVTLFKGIFYHLPDPIRGLKVAADLTREVLILNTAVRAGMQDGMLWLGREPKEPLMSGVYGLNWFPTGPNVLIRILEWMGFVETRINLWRVKANDRQRIEVVASRKEGLLKRVPSLTEPSNS